MLVGSCVGGEEAEAVLVWEAIHCENGSCVFLKWLLNLKDHNGRLMRWALLLQDYTYVIMHRAGKAHANADALSRLIQLGYIESQQTAGQSSASQEKPDQPFICLRLLMRC